MVTPFERSGGTSTGTYVEVIDYYKRLSQLYPDNSRLVEMGMTDSGYPLHLFIISSDRPIDLNDLKDSEEVRILVNNGIHPGEPDGIEASMMLARDLLKNNSIPDNLIIAFIPVYNIGGALNRNSTSRVNQNGPDAYGFRGNARNYDLNRDFIKSDTRNARSFHKLFHTVKPDLFIDTHVSNGADYQYPITHLATQHNRIGGEMGNYIQQVFTPALEEAMETSGYRITPYVNVFNRTPDARGFSQFMDAPRYSTGYTSLFGTLGFMIETHMLKPFDIRVRSTYAFLEHVIEIAEQDGEKIRDYRLEVIEAVKPGEEHAIDWKLDETTSRMISFAGYEGEMIKSEVTGLERLKYDRNKPYEKEIPYFDTFVPSKVITVPSAYIIPQGWHEVISLLLANGAEFQRFEADTSLYVEAYQIESFTPSTSPYEGHYPHREVSLNSDKREIKFRKGDYIIPLPQRSGRYIVETLEPGATDSFFRWNFFDTILQQKEGFSPYVFEDLALEILQKNPSLKEEFEEKKNSDEEFAASWYQQLNFIYENSDYKEKAYRQYPVYRLIE